jgi:hypothetical protein
MTDVSKKVEYDKFAKKPGQKVGTSPAQNSGDNDPEHTHTARPKGPKTNFTK